MFARLFTDHPKAVDETYFQHMGVALGFAGTLALAAGAALVHALIPALCEKTASTTIARLYAKTSKRGPEPATATETASPAKAA
ncbi:DUF6356 family protein [Pseudaestuariivita sp.]|uniref:DUF6356 family protein n=1 Tax=Pseudaestuariivita sp. TaxID=2211669 RepID=UPI004059B837